MQDPLATDRGVKACHVNVITGLAQFHLLRLALEEPGQQFLLGAEVTHSEGERACGLP